MNSVFSPGFCGQVSTYRRVAFSRQKALKMDIQKCMNAEPV